MIELGRYNPGKGGEGWEESTWRKVIRDRVDSSPTPPRLLSNLIVRKLSVSSLTHICPTTLPSLKKDRMKEEA